MKPLAGPALLLTVLGGFALYRSFGTDDVPSRKFRELEFAGADADHTGTCYSLDTVLLLNRVFSDATRTWTSPREGAWTLKLQEVVNGYGGPQMRLQQFTFEKAGDQVRLVNVEASEGLSTDLAKNVDELIEEPNYRKSTPVARCAGADAVGYGYKPR